jgi:DNA-binding transcriptional LysR family regulator
LEKRLGARLFKRRQTGYVLTGSGEGICAEAEAAEESILALERKARHCGAHVIAPHLSEFRALHLDIELEIVTQMDVLNLTRPEADIAVRSAKPEGGGLIARRIGSWGVWPLCVKELRRSAQSQAWPHRPFATRSDHPDGGMGTLARRSMAQRACAKSKTHSRF